MKASELEKKIALAAALDVVIKNSEKELVQLKAELIDEARTRVTELEATDSGGMKWSHETKSGHSVAIAFPAPGIIREFDSSSENFAGIRLAAGKLFGSLFKSIYRPAKDFRSVAAAILTDKAPDLIKLLETESAPRCTFSVS